MDIDSLPKSTMGIVGAVLLSLFGLFGRWMSSRKDRNDDLERQISETEEALRLALENGMITDAQRLSRRLERLRQRFGSRVVALCSVLLLSLTGCGSLRSDKKVEYVVVGERISIVEPGQVVTVPELIPPAKQWYMVDNVGLEGWLGIGGR